MIYMTTSVKNIIIGFGKAGKTLAGYLGSQGEETILIEKSKAMYGGTCINVGCIPTKKLATKAARKQYSTEEASTYYAKSVQEKKALISALNQANYNKVDSVEKTTIIDGTARFVDDHTVAVETAEGEKLFKAERIFINTGATPFVPPVEGLTIGGNIHTSETIMDVEEYPESLVIIGSGFIGLEFAATYAQFGTKVTVVDVFDTFLPREDDDVSSAVKEQLESLGISFHLGIQLKNVHQEDGKVIIQAVTGEGTPLAFTTDAVLVGTGRRANIQGLDLDKAGVAVSERGTIQVNEFLQTNVPHIFAMGDVNGGPQFTFVSLDDFRIVKRFLAGDTSYSTKHRAKFPTATFINPPLASVGLNEKQAKEAGIEVKVAKLPAMAIPKAKIIGNQVGFYKVLVDASNNQIVGATLFAEEAHEVINIIATAMNANLPYTVLRDQIFTHPTMAEALNDVFGMIQ